MSISMSISVKLADAHKRLTPYIAKLVTTQPNGFNLVDAVRASPEGLKLNELLKQLQAAGGESFDVANFHKIASGADINESVLQLGSVVNALKLKPSKKQQREVDSSITITEVADDDVVLITIPPRGNRNTPKDPNGCNIACRICGRVVNTRQGAIDHRSAHTGERRFRCKEKDCRRRYSHRSNLRQHMLTHKDKDAKPYKCKYEGCNKAYSGPSTLKDHLFEHQGVRPYQCPGCTKTFKSRSNLNRHKKRFHGETESTEGGSIKKQRTMAQDQLPMPMSAPVLTVPAPALALAPALAPAPAPAPQP